MPNLRAQKQDLSEARRRIPAMLLLIASLSLNALVLIPVLFTIYAGGNAATISWGPDSPARRILAAIYAAILAASAALLLLVLSGRDVRAWAQALLGLQVFYKLLTLPLVGIRNPVVISNIAIAVVHTITLVALTMIPS